MKRKHVREEGGGVSVETPEPGEISPKLVLFVLAVSLGPLAFLLNLWPHLGSGRKWAELGETPEWRIFVTTCATAPLISLACAAIYFRVRNRASESRGWALDRTVAAANLLLAFLGIAALFLTRFSLNPALAPSRIIPVHLFVTIIVNAALFRFATPGRFARVFPSLVFRLTPLLVFFTGWMICDPPNLWQRVENRQGWGDRDVSTVVIQAFLAGGVGGCLGMALWPLLARRALKRPVARTFDVLVVFALMAVTLNTSFPWDHYHMDFWLGPTHDLMHGRALMWNIRSGYGIGPIYLLAGVFGSGVLPFTHYGFSALISLADGLQYVILYGIMRLVARSVLIPTLVTALVVVLSFFAPLGDAHWFPATGGLRFALPFVLVLVHALPGRFPRFARAVPVIEGFLVGLASIWSIEVLVYLLAAFAGIAGCQLIRSYETGTLTLRGLVRRAAWPLAFMVVFQSAFALHVFSSVGHLPRWLTYSRVLSTYTADFGGPASAWEPWSAVAFMLFVGSVYVLLSLTLWRRHEPDRNLAIISGLTFIGLTQFTYFLFKSSMQFLASVVMAPLVILAVLSARVMGESTTAPPWLRNTCAYTLSALLIGSVVVARFDIATESKHSALVQLALFPGGKSNLGTAWERLWNMPPLDGQVVDTIALIRKYAADKPKVAVFLAPNLTLDVLRRTGKLHAFEISNMLQDDRITSYTLELPYQHDLGPGDHVFFGRTTPRSIPMETAILRRLYRQFRWEPVETSPTGVVAFELKTP